MEKNIKLQETFISNIQPDSSGIIQDTENQLINSQEVINKLKRPNSTNGMERDDTSQEEEMKSQLNDDMEVNRNKRMKIPESDECEVSSSTNSVVNKIYEASSQRSSQDSDQFIKNDESDLVKETKDDIDPSDTCDLMNTENDVDSQTMNQFHGFSQVSDDIDQQHEHIINNAYSILTESSGTTQSTDLLGHGEMEDIEKRKEEVDMSSMEKLKAKLDYSLPPKDLSYLPKEQRWRRRRYRCGVCKTIFNKVDEYHKHVETHLDYSMKERRDEGNSKLETYFCKSCQLAVSGKNEFLRHFHEIHPTERIKMMKFLGDTDDKNIAERRKRSNEGTSSLASFEAKKLMNSKLVNSVKQMINERRRNRKLNSKQDLIDNQNAENLIEQNVYQNKVLITKLKKNNENKESIEFDQKKDEMTLDELHKVLDAKEDDLDEIMYEQKVNDISELYKNIKNVSKNEMKEEEDVFINSDKEEENAFIDNDNEEKNEFRNKEKEEENIFPDKDVVSEYQNRDNEEDVLQNTDNEEVFQNKGEDEEALLNRDNEEDVSLNRDNKDVFQNIDNGDVLQNRDNGDILQNRDNEDVLQNRDNEEDVSQNRDNKDVFQNRNNEDVLQNIDNEKEDVFKNKGKPVDAFIHKNNEKGDVLKNVNKENHIFTNKDEEENYIQVDIPYELEISTALQMNKELNLDDTLTEDLNDTTSNSTDIENIIITEDKIIKKPPLTIIRRAPYKPKQNIKFISILRKNDDDSNRNEMLEQEILTKELLNAKLKYGQNIKMTIRNRKIVLSEQKIVKKELLKILANNIDIYDLNAIPIQSYASELLIQDVDIKNFKISEMKRKSDMREMINEEILSKELLKLGIVKSACLEYNENLDEEMKMVKSIILQNGKKKIKNNRSENILRIPSKSFLQRELFVKTINSDNDPKFNMENNLNSGIYPKSMFKLNGKGEELSENNEKIPNEPISELLKKFVKSSGVHRINNINCPLEIANSKLNNTEIWYRRQRIPIKFNIQAKIFNRNNLPLGYRNLNSTGNIINREPECRKRLIVNENVSKNRFEDQKQGPRFVQFDKNKYNYLCRTNKTYLNTSSNALLRKIEMENSLREKERSLNYFDETNSNKMEPIQDIKSILNGSLSVREDFEKYNELENSLNQQDSSDECRDMKRKGAEKYNTTNGQNKRQKTKEYEFKEKRNEETKEDEETRDVASEIHGKVNETEVEESDEVITESNVNSEGEINTECPLEVEETNEVTAQSSRELEKTIETESNLAGIETEEDAMRLIEELGINNNVQNNENDDLAPFLELDFNMLPHGLRMNGNGGDILLDMAHRMIDRLR